MVQKQLIFPKYMKNTRVKLEFGRDEIIGTIQTISIAPPNHPDRISGSHIYLIRIESVNGSDISKKGNVTTAGEEEITPI